MTAAWSIQPTTSNAAVQERRRGSWDEYWKILEQGQYQAEFQNGEIILEMSYEPELHSKLANRLGYLLEIIYESADFEIFNSNRPVYIPACETVFNPDTSVVQLPKELYTYQPGMTAELSAVLVAEVLSPSTRHRDFTEKLPCYKRIPTLRYILFIELSFPLVYLYQKDQAAEIWKHTFYDNLEDGFEINGHILLLKDIYKRISFPASDSPV